MARTVRGLTALILVLVLVVALPPSPTPYCGARLACEADLERVAI